MREGKKSKAKVYLAGRGSKQSYRSLINTIYHISFITDKRKREKGILFVFCSAFCSAFCSLLHTLQDFVVLGVFCARFPPRGASLSIVYIYRRAIIIGYKL